MKVCGSPAHLSSSTNSELTWWVAVVQFVMSPESGVEQIPAILRGDKSVSSDSQLGSKDYSKTPICIILGGGYDDASTEILMNAAKDVKSLPWLRPDSSKPSPPVGPEYGKALVQRIKELIPQLEKDGKMNEAKVFWY
jgi:hypothetical protein